MIKCSTVKQFQLLKRLTGSTPSTVHPLNRSTVQLFHRSTVPPLTVLPLNRLKLSFFHRLTGLSVPTVSASQPYNRFNILNRLPPQPSHCSTVLLFNCSTVRQFELFHRLTVATPQALNRLNTFNRLFSQTFYRSTVPLFTRSTGSNPQPFNGLICYTVYCFNV